MNQTPRADLIRLKDVLAWMPNLTRDELEELEAAGVIHPVRYARKGYPRRKGKLGRRWYRTSELVKVFCSTNGHEQVKGAKVRK